MSRFWVALGVVLTVTIVSIATGQVPPDSHFRRTPLPNGDTSIEISRAAKAGPLPVGSLMPYAGGVVPEGWLLCDGSFVTINAASRPLLNAIQTRFGGDGQKNFRLPDLRGRTLAGLDNMGGSAAHRITEAWGSRLGSDGYGGADHTTLSKEQMPNHSHHANTGNDGGKHTHLIAYRCEIGHGGSDRGTEYTRATPNANVKFYSDFETNGQGGGHVHDFSTDPAGGLPDGSNRPFFIVQPTAVINYLIKY